MISFLAYFIFQVFTKFKVILVLETESKFIYNLKNQKVDYEKAF